MQYPDNSPFRQTALGLQLRPEARLDNFVGADNQPILQALASFVAGELDVPVFYLWAESGYGRSHLLQAACQKESLQRAIYLPLAELGGDAARILESIESCSLVCIDDLEVASGDGAIERALFNAFNRLRAAGGRMLVSASCPPSLAGIELPDLRSRLSSGVVWEIRRPEDEELVTLLTQGARERGLELAPEVAGFLVGRLPRGPGELLAALNRLDQASLEEKKRLTLPFVKKVLGL